MIGVLLVNLGTPDAPTTKALRKYLREFLSDPRVVKIPRLLWWLILYGFILPFRPQRSAKLYQNIWTKQGSPLKVLSQQLTDKIQQQLDQQAPDTYRVVLGMRYGNPSIKAALATLPLANMEKLIIFPLYPQYSATTTASVFDGVAAALQKSNWLPQLTMINQYASNPAYITAIAESIKQYWQQNGRGEKLLFSFHGIPKQFISDGDPYEAYCKLTTTQVAQQLDLTADEWQLVFQSRFGKAEWLTPYCDITLQGLAQKGYKTIDIICPGFAVDCLETLEEIAIQNKELFIQAGGEKLNYIPALNDSDPHANLLANIIANED